MPDFRDRFGIGFYRSQAKLDALIQDGLACDVCGRAVADDEACWPHDRDCTAGVPHDDGYCWCHNVTCPACCWDCNAIESPA